MKILSILLYIFYVYESNKGEDDQNKIKGDVIDQLANQNKGLNEQDQSNKSLVQMLSKDDSYNITVIQRQIEEEDSFYHITFMSNDLFQKSCYLYTNKSLSDFKYIKIVSSDLKLKFNDKSYQKLIKIENRNHIDINILNKSILDISTNCLTFVEPVQEKTIYIILTEEQVKSDSQLVFTNGKYEKIPDVHGYFVYDDYYKRRVNFFYKALPIYEKFDIFEEIKPVTFIHSKDNKSFLELNVNILLQTSRTFQLINYDTKTQNDVKIPLSQMNIFFKVLDNVLYIFYFNTFYNNFYFFLGKNLFYYDNEKTELKAKAQNMSYYIIQNDYQNKQLMTQNLFETNEQLIFEIGSDQFPVYPKIYYSQIISQKNPQDINNIVVFYFQKNNKKQIKKIQPNLLCYEYFDNMIKPTNNLILFEDKFSDDSSIDKEIFDDLNIQQISNEYQYQKYLNIQGTRQQIILNKNKEDDNVLFQTNNISEIQQMKIRRTYETNCNIDRCIICRNLRGLLYSLWSKFMQ